MLRSYYEACGGASLSKGERNFSMYLKKLSALADEDDKPGRPDKRVVQMLTQVKDHYRTPLLSTENHISADEAMQVFGMVSGLISLMAEQIKSQVDAENKSRHGQGIDLSVTSIENEIYDFPLSQAG
jgi:hypothetical protein